MATTHVTDHVARGLARLKEQFKAKPNIEAWLTVLLTPVQRLEDALYQLLTERGIDNAIGAQLDALGKIVGQVRDGRTDEVYRRFIRARISVNKSNGLIEDVLTVTRLVLDDADADLLLSRTGPATLLLQILNVTIELEVAELLVGYFLRDTVAAGVQLILETSGGAAQADLLILDSGALDSKKLADALA